MHYKDEIPRTLISIGVVFVLIISEFSETPPVSPSTELSKVNSLN